VESEVSERGEVVFNGKRVTSSTIWERIKFKIKYNINKVRIFR
jgi:ABC-type branched-subunit amino acid transport system ATPase component